MNAEWAALQRAVRILADMYVGLDLENELLYLSEAEEFCNLLPPATATELDCLTADAELLVRRWSERVPEEAGTGSRK